MKVVVNIENTGFICPTVGAGQMRDKPGQNVGRVTVSY